MGRIRLLDEQLANRIAAGEVVDRPAAAVKELVENALDAGARRIEVQAAGGGKRFLRIEDDGSGMDRDDALLAFERHATSKLRSFEDLEAIATLGFRGEALPSIASVSRLLLRTAPEDGTGTEVEIRGGRILAVRETSRPRGTWIEVAGLFFNVPARRKFLRAEATELGHVLRGVTQSALAHPSVRFRLEHEGKTLIDVEPAGDRAERIGRLFGSDLARKLLPFSLVRDGIAVSGFAGRPAEAAARRDAQHLFVNGRRVQDRTLLHALSEAYANTVPAGRHPPVFLFVELDPGEVDVNVHPQKAEVRFRRSSAIHDAVRDAVGACLGKREAVPGLGDLRPHAAGHGGAATAVLSFLDRESPVVGQPAKVSYVSGVPGSETGAFGVADARRPPSLADVAEAALPAAWVLAQYRDSYVVAQDGQGLVLVDQHAAHERILFERYLAEADAGRVEVQRLLLPLTLEVTPQEAALLGEEGEELRRLGFAVEPFGPGAVRLDTVPAVASSTDPELLLREVLGEAGGLRNVVTGVGDLRRRLVTTAACQAAIKIHTPLSPDAMQHLLDDLYRCSNPTTCPHGRPIVFRLPLDEIERAFRRR